MSERDRRADAGAVLDDAALLRYSRQILLPEIDAGGQARLLQSTALIVGLGGLGSPVAMYLAAAGVGHLVLADDDVVDLSNLQRQIIHDSDAVHRPKVASARARIAALNPAVVVDTVQRRLEGAALAEACARADVVVDGSDSFETRFALNTACMHAGVPLVMGAAVRLAGQVSVFDPRRADSPCYRCLYEETEAPAESCSENGVIAPLLGIIGSVQATEALKLLAGFGEPLVGRVLRLDAAGMRWRESRLPRDPACPVCGDRGRA